MSNRKLIVEILGDDRSLHRAFTRSEHAARSFSASLTHAAGSIARAGIFAGGAAGAGAFFAVLHDGINEIKESQQVTAATQAVIKSTGAIANVSAKQVDNLELSISNLSVFDDEAVKHGENLLLTFRNVKNEAGKGNDIFNQATLQLANMAAAFKDAGEKGTLGAAGS